MSRSYLKPFTSKKAISFVFLGLSCFVFNNPAYSEGDSKITGHYYVATDKSYEKYTDKIQWEVTSVAEWSKLLANLKEMPKDLEKNNPMGLKQPEVIHFNVVNSDQKSGHDIFISKAGIQQFSKMPADKYYDPSIEFKEFLETELSMNPGYDTTSGPIDVNTPGIVVIYRGSVQLKNPSWVIKMSDKKVLARYKTSITTLSKKFNKVTPKSMENDDIFQGEGTFIVYLNYPDAVQQYLVVGKDGSIRGTKIVPQYYYYKDMMGYFSMFKRQAEDNLRATKLVEDAPEVQRRREVIKGELF